MPTSDGRTLTCDYTPVAQGPTAASQRKEHGILRVVMSRTNCSCSKITSIIIVIITSSTTQNAVSIYLPAS
jgi:hypothetical protein